MDDFYESTDDGMEEIEDAFEKYSGKGFFVIDMKFVKNEFINDVKADIALLESIYLEWFGEEDIIKFDPKLESFIHLVREKLSNEPNRKLVVFSEFADTANYLGAALKDAGLPALNILRLMQRLLCVRLFAIILTQVLKKKCKPMTTRYWSPLMPFPRVTTCIEPGQYLTMTYHITPRG